MSAPREEPTAEALEAAAARLLDNAAVKIWNGWRGDGWKVSRDRRFGWSFMVDFADRITGLEARGVDGYPTAQAAAAGLLKRHPGLWPAEPDETRCPSCTGHGWLPSFGPAGEPEGVGCEACGGTLSTRGSGLNTPAAPQPQPLTVDAREALRLLVDANHGEDGTLHHCCYACSDPWPCEVEQARRILADALDPNTAAAALVALDSLEASR